MDFDGQAAWDHAAKLSGGTAKGTPINGFVCCACESHHSRKLSQAPSPCGEGLHPSDLAIRELLTGLADLFWGRLEAHLADELAKRLRLREGFEYPTGAGHPVVQCAAVLVVWGDRVIISRMDVAPDLPGA